MTAATISAEWKAQGAQHWLVTAWQEGLERALEPTAGADELRLYAAVPDPEAWTAWPEPIWCRLSLGATANVVYAAAPRPAVETLGRLIAADAGLDAARCQDAFFGLLNQAASVVAERASVQLKQQIPLGPAQQASPPAVLEYPVQLEFQLQGVGYAVGLVLGPDLVGMLGGDESLPAQVSVLPPATAATPGNLDLLLEVELPLVVTFGRTQLPLKDVLRLSSGSIVELNRLANEPVEVLINNCVIARGEVVVVDGNYGIRVTEIVSRQERIRSIF